MQEVVSRNYTIMGVGFDLRDYPRVEAPLPRVPLVEVTFLRRNEPAEDDTVTLRTSPESAKRAMEEAGYSVRLYTIAGSDADSKVQGKVDRAAGERFE